MIGSARIHPWRLIASSLLVLVALAFGGQAFYLDAKAWLAQRLLFKAWESSEQSSSVTKPWPWADVHPAGLLEIPEQGIRQVVLNDHSGEALAFGPGIARGNNAVMLAGHRDSHFEFMSQLDAGDHIRWQEAGKTGKDFRISAAYVLDTRLQEEIVPPGNTLLLVTCYPFDAMSAGGPLRYVVVAEEVLKL
ncbi:class GN sortase [Proteobacteria bacterium 005FR1]|nr:class GN sortase [Proteobacteria bacterium 005FR1]